MKRVRGVAYPLAIEKNTGEFKFACDLTKGDRDKSFYLIGLEEEEAVHACVGDVRRPHYKLFPDKIKEGKTRANIDRKNYTETCEHLYVKRAFEKGIIKKLILPPMFIGSEVNKLYVAPIEFNIKEVMVEKRQNIDNKRYVKYDITLINEYGAMLRVEIKVTHACDEVKIQKVKELKELVVEIDIGRYHCNSGDISQRDLDNIVEAILNNEVKIEWVNNEYERTLNKYADHLIYGDSLVAKRVCTKTYFEENIRKRNGKEYFLPRLEGICKSNKVNIERLDCEVCKKLIKTTYDIDKLSGYNYCNLTEFKDLKKGREVLRDLMNGKLINLTDYIF